MKYLVIGGSGLIGSRFVELTKKNNIILSPGEKELDITSGPSVDNFFKNSKFDIVVNFAAYTNVDGAEKERPPAHRASGPEGDKKGIVWGLNVGAAENLAKACKKYDKFLIHISTDFIFPGTKENPGPYAEDVELPGEMEKIGWYGWTKLEGEKQVRKINKNAAIVRTAYPFRTAYEQKLDFARNILALFDEGKLYPLFSDQKLTPVLIDDLVGVLEKIANLKRPGIYHTVTSDVTTPYDFANYLLEKARGVKNAVIKGSMEEYLKTPDRTPRPRLGGLKSEKTQKILGMKFKTWRESVDEFVRQVKSAK